MIAHKAGTVAPRQALNRSAQKPWVHFTSPSPTLRTATWGLAEVWVSPGVALPREARSGPLARAFVAARQASAAEERRNRLRFGVGLVMRATLGAVAGRFACEPEHDRA